MNVSARVETVMELAAEGLLRPKDRIIDHVIRFVAPSLYQARMAKAERAAVIALLLGTDAVSK